MLKKWYILFVLASVFSVSTVSAQDDSRPIKIFGYFQNSYEHQTTSDAGTRRGSFSLQQLNLFFQKDLSDNWRAFVSFEFVNSFASQNMWGDASLEEAWVRYRLNYRFNLKLGLQIPIFNNFNEIKNRTPLLPYVVRPLMYETSFNEIVDVSIGVPYRTFVQVYGFLPLGNAKFDYAMHLGNSPNINSDITQGITGRDTTTSFLIGGRIGLRIGELKLGVSGTYDRTNEFTALGEQKPSLVRTDSSYMQLDRGRFGADLSFRHGPLSWESEIILIDYENPRPNVGTDATFAYGTLGVQATDRLLVYATGWLSHFNGVVAFPDQIVISLIAEETDASIDVASIGAAYHINDRLVIKGQFAEVEVSGDSGKGEYRSAFEYFATAVSVWF